jgi:hypothetical protein
VETRPSLAPNTAALNHPMRPTRWRSRCRCRRLIICSHSPEPATQMRYRWAESASTLIACDLAARNFVDFDLDHCCISPSQSIILRFAHARCWLAWRETEARTNRVIRP